MPKLNLIWPLTYFTSKFLMHKLQKYIHTSRDQLILHIQLCVTWFGTVFPGGVCLHTHVHNTRTKDKLLNLWPLFVLPSFSGSPKVWTKVTIARQSLGMRLCNDTMTYTILAINFPYPLTPKWTHFWLKLTPFWFKLILFLIQINLSDSILWRKLVTLCFSEHVFLSYSAKDGWLSVSGRATSFSLTGYQL